MKVVLIVTILTASILFSHGTTNQAHAFNVVLSIGSQKIENVVKLAKKEDEQVLGEREQAEVEAKMQLVEPAAGE